jgi:hypothetical protein
MLQPVVCPGILFGGGVQQIHLRTEGREKGGLWAVAPKLGVPLNLQMSETRILIRFLRMYIPRNWEFGPALVKHRNCAGGLNPQTPPQYATGCSEWRVLKLPVDTVDTR